MGSTFRWNLICIGLDEGWIKADDPVLSTPCRRTSPAKRSVQLVAPHPPGGPDPRARCSAPPWRCSTTTGWAGTTLAAIAERGRRVRRDDLQGLRLQEGAAARGHGRRRRRRHRADPLRRAPRVPRPRRGHASTSASPAAASLVADIHERSAGIWQAIVEAASGDDEVDAWRLELEQQPPGRRRPQLSRAHHRRAGRRRHAHRRSGSSTAPRRTSSSSTTPACPAPSTRRSSSRAPTACWEPSPPDDQPSRNPVDRGRLPTLSDRNARWPVRSDCMRPVPRCPGRGSNPHGAEAPEGFKPSASASSATRAGPIRPRYALPGPRPVRRRRRRVSERFELIPQTRRRATAHPRCTWRPRACPVTLRRQDPSLCAADVAASSASRDTPALAARQATPVRRRRHRCSPLNPEAHLVGVFDAAHVFFLAGTIDRRVDAGCLRDLFV